MKRTPLQPPPRRATSAARTVLAASVVLLLTGTAVQRNSTWHTLLAMWQDCAEKSPQKSRTHNNLGNCYLLLGRHFDAIAEYQKAVALAPGNLEAQYNLAVRLDNVGLFAPAIQPYGVFCKFAPPTLPEQQRYACERYEALRSLTTTSGKAPGSR